VSKLLDEPVVALNELLVEVLNALVVCLDFVDQVVLAHHGGVLVDELYHFVDVIDDPLLLLVASVSDVTLSPELLPLG